MFDKSLALIIQNVNMRTVNNKFMDAFSAKFGSHKPYVFKFDPKDWEYKKKNYTK